MVSHTSVLAALVYPSRSRKFEGGTGEHKRTPIFNPIISGIWAMEWCVKHL